jgi:hypothetical protein
VTAAGIAREPLSAAADLSWHYAVPVGLHVEREYLLTIGRRR